MQTAAHTYIQKSHFATPRLARLLSVGHFLLVLTTLKISEMDEAPMMPFHATLIFGFLGRGLQRACLAGLRLGQAGLVGEVIGQG